MSVLDDVYGALYQDMSALHARWKVFCQLYATDKETVELLDSSAAAFFRLCQDTFADDVLPRISRLTDRHRTFSKDNLSMERLVISVGNAGHAELKKEMEKLLVDAGSKCAFARDLRNRRLAHSDWPTGAQEVNAPPLPVVEKRNIDAALAALRAIMAKVELHLDDKTVPYGDPLIEGDGNALVNRLRDARTFREQRRQSRSG